MFGADDEFTAREVIRAKADEEKLPWPFRWLANWIILLLAALAVAVLGFATYGVVLVFRYLIGLNW
jgi:hypothetical protein